MKEDVKAIVDKAMERLDSMSDQELFYFVEANKDNGIFTELLSNGLKPVLSYSPLDTNRNINE